MDTQLDPALRKAYIRESQAFLAHTPGEPEIGKGKILGSPGNFCSLWPGCSWQGALPLLSGPSSFKPTHHLRDSRTGVIGHNQTCKPGALG